MLAGGSTKQMGLKTHSLHEAHLWPAQIGVATRVPTFMLIDQPNHKMNTVAPNHKWDERTSAAEQLFKHSGAVFESLFEQCPDAIWLYDPKTIELVDCNQAA